MDSIQIDTGKVKTIAVSIGDVRTQMINEFNELMSAVSSLRNSWKTDNGAASHIAEAAIKVFGQISEQHMDMVDVQLEQMVKYLYEAVGEQYEATEEKNKDQAGIGEANSSSGVSGGTTTGGAVTSGAVAGGTAGAVAGGVTSGNTGSANTVVNNGNIIGYSSSGAPRYKLPDYVYQGLSPDANGVWGEYVYLSNGRLGRICTWNKAGELSCTYYTLRKLNKRGLSYPCVAGPGNGGDWYANFDTASGAPSFGGVNALEDLSSSISLPQENIVVSFERNPSTDPSLMYCGHVLLIDRIYKDANGNVMVQWSDNWPSIPDVNGSNPVQTASIAQFKSQYYKNNGNIKGVVVVGAGDNLDT